MEKMDSPLNKEDKQYTYADYKNRSDEEKWELINGLAWNMSPVPSRRHQWLIMELMLQIRIFLKGKKCQVYPAPFDVLFPENKDQSEDDIKTVVQPDLLIICDNKKLTEKGCLGAPDLIVEILSPLTALKDEVQKLKLYEIQGVKEYWIVNPEAKYIMIYKLENSENIYGKPEYLKEDDLLKSMVLDGLTINLTNLFCYSM